MITPINSRLASIQYRTLCEDYLANNKACVSLFQTIAKSALLLNGMACVAILYSPRISLDSLYKALLIYGLAALLAAVSASFAYLTQFLIVMDMGKQILGAPPVGTQTPLEKHCRKLAQAFRWTTGVFVAASYAGFAWASLEAYYSLV